MDLKTESTPRYVVDNHLSNDTRQAIDELLSKHGYPDRTDSWHNGLEIALALFGNLQILDYVMPDDK